MAAGEIGTERRDMAFLREMNLLPRGGDDSLSPDQLQKLAERSNDLHRRYLRHCAIEYLIYFFIVAAVTSKTHVEIRPLGTDLRALIAFWGLLFFASAYQAYVAAILHVQNVCLTRYLERATRTGGKPAYDIVSLTAESVLLGLLGRTPDGVGHSALKRALDCIQRLLRLSATTGLTVAAMVLVVREAVIRCGGVSCLGGKGWDALFAANVVLTVAALCIHLWQIVYRAHYGRLLPPGI